LLVVVAIIALLVALLLPALRRARRQAKAMVCRSNLRQWAMVLATYTEDHQGRFPSKGLGVDGVWLLRGAFLTGNDPNAPQDTFHHFNTKKIACCPMATRAFGGLRFGATIGTTSFGSSYKVEGSMGSALGAWKIKTPAPAFRGSYGLNLWLFTGLHENPEDSAQLRDGRIDLDVLSLRGRSGIPVLLDGTCPLSWARDTDPPSWDPDLGAFHLGYFCTNCHQDSVNGLFLDWSVRKVGLKELWTLNWYTEFNRAGKWTKAGGVQPEDWPKWMRNFKDY
jgi:type II secretory pathway pseudopilin PulG